MKSVSDRAEKNACNRIQSGLKYKLGHARRLSCECKTLCCKFSWPNFKHCAWAEIGHVIAAKFQPGGPTEISARAEICHVIGPSVFNKDVDSFNKDISEITKNSGFTRRALQYKCGTFVGKNSTGFIISMLQYFGVRNIVLRIIRRNNLHLILVVFHYSVFLLIENQGGG